MCGFVFGYSDHEHFTPFKISQSLDSIKHRGPDSIQYIYNTSKIHSSFHVDDSYRVSRQITEDTSMFLGFARLSIIDTSSSSNQPCVSPSGRYVLACNGEIYNYKEICQMHLSKAQIERLSGLSDTIHIASLIDEIGFSKTLEIIDGMFSLIVIDKVLGLFHFLRDPFGIKPLYFHINKNSILVSSEIKPILHLNPELNSINHLSFPEIALFGHNAGENCEFFGIQRCLPRHFYTYNVNSSRLDSSIYYAYPSFGPSLNYNNKKSAYDILQNSVDSHLISDVPLGVQLSGGLDSSLITYFSSQRSEDLHAYGVTPGCSSLSEIQYMNKAISRSGVLFNEVSLNRSFNITDLLKCTYINEAVLHHSNSLGLLRLAERASKNVKVLLSGEGADEIFGGYERFFLINLFNIPGFATLQNLLSPFLGDKPYSGITRDKTINYIHASSFNHVAVLNKLSSHSYMDCFDTRVELFNLSGASFAERCFNYELRTYLQSLLHRQDRMMMAYSIEGRVPFLTRKLLSEVRSTFPVQSLIGLDFKRGLSLVNSSTKKPIKKLASFVFGNDFAYRKKMGFALDDSSITSQPECKSLILRKLNDLASLYLLPKSTIHSITNNYENLPLRFRLTLLNTSLFLESFFS